MGRTLKVSKIPSIVKKMKQQSKEQRKSPFKPLQKASCTVRNKIPKKVHISSSKYKQFFKERKEKPKVTYDEPIL